MQPLLRAATGDARVLLAQCSQSGRTRYALQAMRDGYAVHAKTRQIETRAQ